MSWTIRYDSDHHNIGLDAPKNGDAGYDLKTPVALSIDVNQIVQVDTGIRVEIPSGYVGLILEKSSVSGGNPEKGFTGGIAIRAGVIDSSYRGNIIIPLQNLSGVPQTFDAGQKIAQLVIVKNLTPTPIRILKGESLSGTERGADGFGSTGKF